MTLEKLLIFGFALAVVTALTLSATSLAKKREPQYEGYKGKVEGLVDATQ